ncbi:hypothetical protein Lser_V15G35795 [Lactuca serriola]
MNLPQGVTKAIGGIDTGGVPKEGVLEERKRRGERVGR